MNSIAHTQTVRGESAAADVRVPFAALVLAMLPAVLDQTVLATGLPTIARDLGELQRRLGRGQRLRGGGHGLHPAVGKARRQARPQAPAPDRAGPVPLLVRALRSGGERDSARGLPGRTGNRRRWADDAGHDRRGRSRGAARAGPLPGLHRRGVRPGHGGGSSGRRAAGRSRRMALGLRTSTCRSASWPWPRSLCACPRACPRPSGRRSTCPAAPCWRWPRAGSCSPACGAASATPGARPRSSRWPRRRRWRHCCWWPGSGARPIRSCLSRCSAPRWSGWPASLCSSAPPPCSR